jgi:DNA polymerase II large subunit
MKESKNMELYFLNINNNLNKCLEIANNARKLGKDPEDKVDIPLASDMAERVEGLISSIAPDLVKTNMAKRIKELEKKYPPQSWEIALIIAEEVAKEKFLKFSTVKEAIEMGIRVGMAYSTSGIVAAPLEGFVEVKIKKRNDNKEYLAVHYAGPIRGAGGTAAAVSVIISDYVRIKMGFEKYDPNELEVKRIVREICDYHERITNLQYFPSEEELIFLIKNIPVEISGDPTEKIEVSNYKDLPRIETNLIRGGMCLVLAEGVAQKAPKLWKRLSKWKEDFDLDWNFLEPFLEIQKKIKSKDQVKEKKEKISPNYTYIADLVAGRPVLGYPMKPGSFRLRYGRTRTSGYSSAALNPATMWLLNNFIAVGTQLKLERPGKAAAITTCDTIDGPIVRLLNGDVIKINKEDEAKKIKDKVEKIIYLGDILFNYGDFSENNHILVPCGYCPEWWVLEVEKATVEMFGTLDLDKLSDFTEIDVEKLELAIKNPLKSKISLKSAINLSLKMNVPLHPNFLFFWKLLNKNELLQLTYFLENGNKNYIDNKLIKIVFKINDDLKNILEKLGVPHIVSNKEFIVVTSNDAKALLFTLNSDRILSIREKIKNSNLENLELLSEICGIKIKDKCGTFIGARMGRPEKAKMRKLTGSPHVLFPVGEEGGRLKSFQSAVSEQKIKSEFPIYYCSKCKKELIFPFCDECKIKTKKMYYCKDQGLTEKKICNDRSKAYSYRIKEIEIAPMFDKVIKQLKLKAYPDVIKGVRGTTNKDHIPENIAKGILRAKHGIYVNKDGTTRYDMTELAITHFTPKEINTSINKLKELGYIKDIYGKSLEKESQIIEIFPQDLILPKSENALEDSADKVLFNVANFIDEMLEKFYGLKPFYNFKDPLDLIGHLVIGLAPHISAGTVGRIIGFSETQACFAHPLYHAALRRDCFYYDTYIPIKKGNQWQIKQIGDEVEKLNPIEVVDDFGTKEIKVKGFKTIGVDGEVNIKNFTKHMPQKIIEIETMSGKKIKTTFNHKHIVKDKIKKSHELKIGDKLSLKYTSKILKNNIKKIDFFNYFYNEDWVMVRGLNKSNIKNYAKNYFSKKEFYNFYNRDSYPIKFLKYLKDEKIKIKEDYYYTAKRDHVKFPNYINIDENFLKLIGLYIAEGYSRKIDKKLYQVYIASNNIEIQNFIKKTMKEIFNINPSEKKTDRVTYSSRLLNYLFIDILKLGSSAYEKRIPNIFLNLPNKKLGYLLSGYFEGDGLVSSSDTRITFDTVSKGLLKDMDFVFSQMNIFVKNYEYESYPGNKVKEFYIKKKREIPLFKLTKGIIQSIFVNQFKKYINFISSKKKNILKNMKKAYRIKQEYDDNFIYDEIKSIKVLEEDFSYCLKVDEGKVIANSILTKQCDGDENCVMLLMDAFLNFSRQFLPDRRGSRTMDSPLVLTSKLVPSEVDDMAHGLDVVWNYPLEFYEAAENYKYPWEIKIDQIKHRLNTYKQYEEMGFTHNISNINKGVLISAYKILPTMEEKLKGQMNLAEKINAVEACDVASAVIQKHFLKDIKGNMRKFSQQQFRCVACNEKFRRPPLSGNCTKCSGKIIFTISEGSVGKYLEPSLSLARKYNVPPYLLQTLELTKRNFEALFGKDKEKQTGLGEWFE